MAPVVQAYQAMRGASFLVAVIFAAEIGDVRRFDTPRQLMSFLGLVPAESSTGDTIRRKGLTLAGNRRARRALVEAAWTYRYPARVSETLRARLEEVPKPVRDIAWAGAGATVRPLPPAQRGGQEAAGGGGRDRARDGGVSLGHRPRGRAHVDAPLASLLHKAGGGARWGTPVASYVAGSPPDARRLDRGKPRDESTEGGSQPADKSLINRRLHAPPPALCSSARPAGRAAAACKGCG